MTNVFSKSFLAFAFMTSVSTLMSCGNADNTSASKPEVTGIKCEYVADGDVAYIYGKNLKNVNVDFPGGMHADIVNASDSVISVVVPKGSCSGKLIFTSANDTIYSNFIFRDKRNVLIDFDNYRATWGGYEPYGDEGEPINSVMSDGSVVTLPAQLPEGCDGDYSLLYGVYRKSWDMKESLWLQYVANPLEGGRGNVSIAGPFEGYPISQLALKFEVNVPKSSPYNNLRTEIFFGPSDAADKHGRDRSPICFWAPFEGKDGFYTDGWETVTIPLTEFNHGIHSDAEKFPTPIDLKKAVNFTFVLFGDAEACNNPTILMCVDNFRVVPISE